MYLHCPPVLSIIRRLGAVGVVIVSAAAQPCCGGAQGSDDARPGSSDRRSASRGLVMNLEGASDGCVLFSPLLSTTTYLVDREGRVVHRWESDRAPGASVYLLENGHLLRCSRQQDRPIFQAGGEGGRIQEYTWDGELVWDYALASPQRVQHHDIEPLPDGNVLAVVWEKKSREEAIRAGRRLELVSEQGLWPDCVLEIEPVRPNGGTVVWEWHLWDHLIQDFDRERENFGIVSEHPGLVDINGDVRTPPLTDELLERLKAIGYVVGNAAAGDLRADLVHTNAIAYHPGLDQIVLSAHRFNEIWIIDHSTTTKEAAGHSGGHTGRGGDLLYRWGNPQVYGRGSPADQQLFAHHDARWIPAGFPGGGHIMVFNNGYGRPGGDYSEVLEIDPRVAPDRSYTLAAGAAYGPPRAMWTYAASRKKSFAADFISGAHRLAGGNTFVCSGPTGRFFEVTPDGAIVWEYLNPFAGTAPNPAGDPPYSVFRATKIAADHPALAKVP